jgi:DNA repair protein RadB
MTVLPLRCRPLDDLLGGGIERGIITRVYGEAGSGKTNLCLQASRECVRAGEKVAYVDTEGVSLERVRQICVDCEYKRILQDILFFCPTTFEAQEQMIQDAIGLKDVGLIVVDTITMLYHLYLQHHQEPVIRSFTRQVTNLQVAAREQNIAVIVTEQVYTSKDGEIRPFTRRDMNAVAKTVLRLERKGMGERCATLMKHRTRPEGSTACFQIRTAGLE